MFRQESIPKQNTEPNSIPHDLEVFWICDCSIGNADKE
jgi:hypothetical protein